MPLIGTINTRSTLTKGFGALAPKESIRDYVQGSYAYDPTPPDSAEIRGNASTHNSLILKGGPRGAKFTVNKYLMDAKGNQTSQSQATVEVAAGKTASVGVGGNVPGMSVGGEQMYVIRLADTFYVAPVVTPPITIKTPDAKPDPIETTPDGRRTNSLDKFKMFMNDQAIPRVPNYVPVSILVVGGVIAVVVVATRK